MHEFSYCEGVLNAVERRAQGRPVARIGVRVGSFHRILPAAFQQSFELVAAGGVAARAVTEVTVVPANARCESCGTAFQAADPGPACPQCGGLAVVVDGGTELVLEWLEYDSPVGASVSERE